MSLGMLVLLLASIIRGVGVWGVGLKSFKLQGRGGVSWGGGVGGLRSQ